MRKAIITQLKTITGFSNRVYQPYLAPAETTKPYCVVKMGEESPVPENFKGSRMGVQIFLYGNPSSFISLDSLELEVKRKLHNIELSTDDSPIRKFTCYYDRTLADFKDDERNLLMKTMYFFIPLARA